MKLAVVTNILTPYRVPLFSMMARCVEDFTVFLMAEQEENRQWQIGPVPFKTKVLNGFHFKPPSSDVSLHWNYGVLSALRRADPDMVLSGGFTPANIAAFVYCKLSRKAYVGWGEFTLRDGAQSSRLKRWVRRWLTSQATGCIASSTEAREAFLHYGAEQHSLLTVLMPIEADRINREAQAFRVSSAYQERRSRFTHSTLLSVGRLTDLKGIRHLFSIYERILAERPDVSLLVVGDGPDRQAYEAYVQHRGWRHVHFLGFVSPDLLPQYFALADVFLFPTLSDTYGAVLAEAMAAECVVVSSSFAAATPDLVRHGSTGFAMNPTLHQAAADIVLDVLAMSKGERAAIGGAAYEVVRHTDIRCSTDSMIGFLGSLVSRPDSFVKDSTVDRIVSAGMF